MRVAQKLFFWYDFCMHSLRVIVNIVGAIIIVWTIPWKIYAVWLAAKHDHKRWFVALVFLNTISILEMIYVFKVEKKTWVEVKADFRHGWDMLKRKK